MSERELLEAAAKAAGIEQPTGQDGYVAQDGTFVFYLDCEGKTSRHWNPLTDDGDCARLETACRLGVIWGDGFVTVGNDRAGLRSEAFEEHAGNESTARRRASTRAAASIGSGKESAS